MIEDNKEEHAFVKKLIKVFKVIDTHDIFDVNCLNSTIADLTGSIEKI